MEYLILRVECLILRVECPILRVECHILRVECLILRVECFILRVECFIPHMECRIPPDKCPVSSLKRGILNIEYDSPRGQSTRSTMNRHDVPRVKRAPGIPHPPPRTSTFFLVPPRERGSEASCAKARGMFGWCREFAVLPKGYAL